MDLDIIREQINALDDKLIKLLEERFKLSLMVGEYKAMNCAKVYSETRENEIIKSVDAKAESYNQEIKTVIKAIMTISRGVQYGKILESGNKWALKDLINKAKSDSHTYGIISYGGKEGSYALEAAKKMFPNAKEYIGTSSFSEAIKAAADGRADAAVLPFENTTAGTVNDVYDLIPDSKLYIVRSLSYMIEHSLLGIKGAKESDIATVISHPQALSQCSAYIKARKFYTLERVNTAYAAEEVSKRGSVSLAAIGSKLSAKLYSLDVIKDNISNESSNQTRFVALSKNLEISGGKVSVTFRLPHVAGSLAWVLFMFAGLDINLTKIQSRPLTDRPWEYKFFVDFMYDDEFKALKALYQLEKELPEITLLGWYKELNN